MDLTDLLVEEPLAPMPKKTFAKCIKAFVDAWPNQDTYTDWIFISQLYYMCPREFVFNYWEPKPNVSFKCENRLMMHIGSVVHDYYQNQILGPMGILYGIWENEAGQVEGYHPDPVNVFWANKNRKPLKWRFVESRVKDTNLRIRGKYDGKVCKNKLDWFIENLKLVKKDIFQAFKESKSIEPGKLDLLEIKTCGTYPYEKLENGDEISNSYKMQSEVYMDLTKTDSTAFLFMDRNTCKMISLRYDMDGKWVKEAYRKCKIVWESIRDEEFPDTMMACKTPDDGRSKKCVHNVMCWGASTESSKYIEVAKEMQPDRKWLNLVGKTW